MTVSDFFGIVFITVVCTWLLFPVLTLLNYTIYYGLKEGSEGEIEIKFPTWLEDRVMDSDFGKWVMIYTPGVFLTILTVMLMVRGVVFDFSQSYVWFITKASLVFDFSPNDELRAVLLVFSICIVFIVFFLIVFCLSVFVGERYIKSNSYLSKILYQKFIDGE